MTAQAVLTDFLGSGNLALRVDCGQQTANWPSTLERSGITHEPRGMGLHRLR
jgi:hypothetical protein